MSDHYVKEGKAFACGGFDVKAASISEKDRTLEATISSSKEDRDGEIVLPSAFEKRIDTYKSNPVLLWNHDPFSPPIGRALEVEIGEKSIEAKFQFLSEGKSQIADQVFAGYQEGILTSFSIGFRAFEIEPGHKNDKGETIPPTIKDAELLEVSAVTIPANTDALVKRARMVETLMGAHASTPTAPVEVKAWTPTDLQILEKAEQIVRERMRNKAAGRSLPEQEARAVDALRMVLLGDFGAEDHTAVAADLDEILAELQSL